MADSDHSGDPRIWVACLLRYPARGITVLIRSERLSRASSSSSRDWASSASSAAMPSG